MFLHRRGYLTSVLAATLLLQGCSVLENAVPTPDIQVAGQALYRERMLLPPGATVEIRLEDVSRADAAAELLAQRHLEAPGAPPYDFRFYLDPDQFTPGHRYSLRASIRQDGRLLFTTDQHYPVPTNKSSSHQLIMKQVQTEAAPAPRAGLVNTYWKLVQLNGQPVQAEDGQREPHLTLRTDGRLQGYSGCNQFIGQYRQTANSLQLGPIAGTLRACTTGAKTEQALLQLLQGEVHWSIQQDELRLRHSTDDFSARFKAVYLQ